MGIYIYTQDLEGYSVSCGLGFRVWDLHRVLKTIRDGEIQRAIRSLLSALGTSAAAAVASCFDWSCQTFSYMARGHRSST